MTQPRDDLRPGPTNTPKMTTEPLAPPISLSAVYRCDSPEQADRLLSGEEHGYVYSRDGHPNADQLADQCCQLHVAERAAVCGSGMAALSAAAMAVLSQGDRVMASNQLYGKSLALLARELPRLGVACEVVDTCDLAAVERACAKPLKLAVVETITNPLLRVSDLAAIAERVHAAGGLLLADNSFAGPTLCRPLEWGADFVLESLTKMMNGHSDVLLGLLCGQEANWARVPQVVSTWGWSAAPFDCWLAMRGLATFALRMERACDNALAAATHLSRHAAVAEVCYPGLEAHADHRLAARQFGGRFGSMVTFTLAGGAEAAGRFIAAARGIPFCPSLGDVRTTLSHPATTSHRGQSAAERESLGILAGTIRLSVGIEPSQRVLASLDEALAAVAN